MKLVKETEDLKKRVTELENRLNKNSQNSSKPPSSDPPYKKPSSKGKSEKSERKRGGQKGHQQGRIELTSENVLFLGPCSSGCITFDPEAIKTSHTQQVIELQEIEMKVQHFIL